jgi:acetylornithine aminotransferase
VHDQLDRIGFYSNSIQNPLQEEYAEKLLEQSDCPGYRLFMCNSGAEANENALKLASFHTGRHKILAFRNSFHGRTSAAVAATDMPAAVSPLNAQQEVTFIDFGDLQSLTKALQTKEYCAVIMECIQGVGGLDMPGKEYAEWVQEECASTGTILIADEVQSGFDRSGKFFAFQHYGLRPGLITLAKGMGNGFPTGGVLIGPEFESSYGLLGTTFGGNHLACAACLAVLEVLEKEHLAQNAIQLEKSFRKRAEELLPGIEVKGKGLMLGLDLGRPVAPIRKELLLTHGYFTGASRNPNVIRILPALNITAEVLDHFLLVLKKEYHETL